MRRLGIASLLAASCAAPGARGRAADEVIFPSPRLEAILRTPAGYDSSRTYPLLVALHGYGDAATPFAAAFASGTWARVFVAVPEAEYPLPNGGYSWFHLTDDRSLWPERDGRTVEAVAGLIDALRARYRIGPVFLLGFSQGAVLAYQVGLLHPSRVAGILAISGAVPPIDTAGAIVRSEDLERARRVRLFVARGRDDARAGRRSFLDQAAFFAARGFTVTRYEFAGGHDLPAEVMERAARWLREASGP